MWQTAVLPSTPRKPMLMRPVECRRFVASSSLSSTRRLGCLLSHTTASLALLGKSINDFETHRSLLTPLSSFQNFFPTLAKATFNYDNNVINLLLAAPPYIFMVIWSLLHSLASDRTGNRFWFFIYPVPIVLIGCFIFMFVENNGARYFSLFLMIFIFAMNGTVSTLPPFTPQTQSLTFRRPTPGSQTPSPAPQPNAPQP